MATTAYTIVDTAWTKITAPGESGICWKQTGKPILVDHTVSTAGTLPISSGAVTTAKAKLVPQNAEDNNVLSIAADGGTDTYYAIALHPGLHKIVADVI